MQRKLNVEGIAFFVRQIWSYSTTPSNVVAFVRNRKIDAVLGLFGVKVQQAFASMKAPRMGKTMSTATEPASLAPTPSERFSDALAIRHDPRACAALIHNQLDVSFYEGLAMSVSLSTKNLFSLLGVSPTIQRRWKKTRQLTISESDYAFRQALVLQDALRLF